MPEATEREHAVGLGSARRRELGTTAEGSGSAEDRGLGSAQEGPGSDRSPGLKGLTARHRDAYANGTLSQVDIARELGVKKQAVQKAFRQRGWSTSRTPAALEHGAPNVASPPTSQTASAGATAPCPDSAPVPRADANDEDWLPDEQRRQFSIAIAQGALRAVGQAIREINNSMSQNAGKIGPSAMNGYMRAMRSALEIGAALLNRPDDNPDMLTSMCIETMSDEDVARIKAEASANHRGINEGDQLQGSDQSVPADNRDEGKPLPAVQPSSPINDSTPLPGRAELRTWLLSRAESHGRRHLRDIAEHVGLRPALQDTDGYLVDSIVHAVDGDPQRLRRPRG